MATFAPAERLERIPPYLFAELDRRIAEKRAAGVDVISLGVGDPDMPTPAHVVERLAREAARPEWHRYPSYVGAPEFRRAAARWLRRNYGVEVDPDREVVALIGSKEGLAHLCWALINPGDVALVPDPGYPVYRTQTIFAGGEVFDLPLRAERGFLADLSEVPPEVAARAKLLFLNYPNNPTAATAGADYFAEVVQFARRHGIAFAHDAAYVDLTLEGERAPIALAAPGAKDVTIEFFSLSKPFNMTGWRLGFAAGNADLVKALATVKENTDSGQFTAIQIAGVEALENTPEEFLRQTRAVYRRRLEKAVAALREAGFDARMPRATFYLWVQVPRGYTSEQVAERMLEEAGIVVSPGQAYGRHGAGYIRLSLTLPDERLDEALARIRRLKF